MNFKEREREREGDGLRGGAVSDPPKRRLARSVKLDTHGGPVTLAPRWLRVPGAVKYSGLSRSKLYELLSDGKIRSICVRSQKGAQRGVRLIDRESIDSFMESHAVV